MLVKICGLTSRFDAAHAIKSGADFVGFVKDSASKRYISGESLREILGDSAVWERSVAVYGPYSGEAIVTKHLQCFLDDSAPDALSFGVARPTGEDEIEQVVEASSHCQYLTLDTFSASEYGGSGIPFDWNLAAKIVERCPAPVFLAGGLTLENVQEAIRNVRPAGVDVSSGVERLPGVKDSDLVLRFIELAKSA